jgi:hypothetical protein
VSYCSEYFWAASMFDPRPHLASNKSPGFGRSMDYDLGYLDDDTCWLEPPCKFFRTESITYVLV